MKQRTGMAHFKDEIAKEIERDKFTEEIVRILRETDYENSL